MGKEGVYRQLLFFFRLGFQLMVKAVGLGRLVVWIFGIPENERDWQPWVYPDSNPKPHFV